MAAGREMPQLAKSLPLKYKDLSLALQHPFEKLDVAVSFIPVLGTWGVGSGERQITGACWEARRVKQVNFRLDERCDFNK